MTRGYHNRPDQNKQAFVQSPFTEITDLKFKGNSPRCDLMYKTGDLMSWSEQGALMYMGRSDSQVKVNGHRMELGEIEANLQVCAFSRCWVLHFPVNFCVSIAPSICSVLSLFT